MRAIPGRGSAIVFGLALCIAVERASLAILQAWPRVLLRSSGGQAVASIDRPPGRGRRAIAKSYPGLIENFGSPKSCGKARRCCVCSQRRL